MKNIAVFNNSTGVVGVLESLLFGDVHMINASTLEELLQLFKCENIEYKILRLLISERGKVLNMAATGS